MSSRAYGPEIKQAALTLHLEGLSSREIRAALSEGRAGLPHQVTPGKRTIDLWRRNWRKEGKIPGAAIKAGEETAIEDAIYRRILALYQHDLQTVEDSICKNGNVNVQAVSRLVRYQAIVDATRYQRQLRETAQHRKLTPEEGGHLGAASAEAKPGPMLRRLAREATPSSITR